MFPPAIYNFKCALHTLDFRRPMIDFPPSPSPNPLPPRITPAPEMQRSTRLPHGARWHAVRSSWRRELPLLVKLLAAMSVVGYFFWNVTTIAHIVQSRAPALRSEAVPVAKGLRDAFAHILEARDSEEAWWLRPETYRKDSGCDFSAAVALFKPEQLELNCANMDELDEGEFIGKGFWREVYRTKWNGEWQRFPLFAIIVFAV
jgi:hypothetical protein